MNNLDRIEFQRLKRRVEEIETKLSAVHSLKAEVAALRNQIEQLQARQNAEAVEDEPVSVTDRSSITPSTTPPPIIDRLNAALSPAPAVASPPTVPQSSETRSRPAWTSAPSVPLTATPDLAGRQMSSSPVSVGTSASISGSAAVAPEAQSSFEMRLGTYWLVRIGIVMLLTAMVFFGRYAYRNYIGQIGPVGKVSLMYLAAGLLLGLGAWLQRKVDALRKYGEVLFAGGLAAVYFTTFAAHYIPNLRIISSALVDGALLLGWAGVMVWLANRRKSEVLAMFAVGLAYYSSAITKIDWFTLFSNFVLTLAVVFFLVRNRWATLSVVSLVATYSSYAYWRFYTSEGWLGQTDLPSQVVQKGVAFLAAYWITFTAAVFLSKSEKLAGPTRVTFGTLNNGAFFALSLLTMAHLNQGEFWKISLTLGLVLAGLAALARRLLSHEPALESAYLVQGLLLVTIGFIAKFGGMQLALVLTAQSVLLLFLGYRLDRQLLRIGSYVVAALGAAWCFSAFGELPRPGILVGITTGGFMLVNCWQVAQREAQREDGNVRSGTTYYTLLALFLWFLTTWYHTPEAYRPAMLAFLALLFTASVYVLGIPEIAICGQLYLMAGQGLWLHGAMWSAAPHPAWSAGVVVSITIGLSHWWQRQQIMGVDRRLATLWQWIYAFGLVMVLNFWLKPFVPVASWICITSLLAVALTLYGTITRAWPIAITGQLFVVLSGSEFLRQLADGHPEWYWALTPILVLGLMSWAAARWIASAHGHEHAVSVVQVARVYRWMALLLAIIWTHEYIPARERCWVFILFGTVLFVSTFWREAQERMLFSAILSAAGFWWLWAGATLEEMPAFYWPNALAILTFLGQQQLARRLPEQFDLTPPSHHGMIIVGGLSLWWFVSRWISLQTAGFYLTVSWTVVALVLFLAGLMLRERMYRWLGLAVLAIAVGRVVLIDVWKLEQVYRIFSFMALGVVLLLLGFLYNKYQEKIRQWL